jgi:hypothetical protein
MPLMTDKICSGVGVGSRSETVAVAEGAGMIANSIVDVGSVPGAGKTNHIVDPKKINNNTAIIMDENMTVGEKRRFLWFIRIYAGSMKKDIDRIR